MIKILIQFPQIVIETKEIEVSEEQAENLISHAGDDGRSAFAWSQLTDQEQSWTFGQNMLESAYEAGYAKIKYAEVPLDLACNDEDDYMNFLCNC